MAPFDAVLFNKEAPDIRRRIVKTNLRKTACFYDKKELAAAANDYYQAYIENRAWQLGIPHLFDSRDNVKPTEPTRARASRQRNPPLLAQQSAGWNARQRSELQRCRRNGRRI